MDPYHGHAAVHYGMPGMPPSYPIAEATHQQVLDDAWLFRATLIRLLMFMGIKMNIPKVAHQPVDLHLLYKEVTGLGGLELVTNHKQWATVCIAFQLPSSCTNKSSMMKKVYVNLLHHYEQVYFHHNTGGVVPPPLTAGEPAATIGSKKRKHDGGCDNGALYSAQGGPTTGFSNQVGAVGARRPWPSSLMPQANTLQPSTRFSGAVKSSFEHRPHLSGQRIQDIMHSESCSTNLPQQQYKGSAVVTGSELLCGGKAAGATFEYRGTATAGTATAARATFEYERPCHPTGGTATATDPQKRMRIEEQRPLTPPRPVYFFFARTVTEEAVRAVCSQWSLEKATARVARTMWDSLTSEERQPFFNEANTDKLRYETESARLSRAGRPCSSSPFKETFVSGGDYLEAQKQNRPASMDLMEYGQPRPGATVFNGANKSSWSLQTRCPAPISIAPLSPPNSVAVAISTAPANAITAAGAAGAVLPPLLHDLGIPLEPGTLEEGRDFVALDGTFDNDADLARFLEGGNDAKDHFTSMWSNNDNTNMPISLDLLGLVPSGDIRGFMGNFCGDAFRSTNGGDHLLVADRFGFSGGDEDTARGNSMEAVMGMPPCPGTGSPISDYQDYSPASILTSAGGDGFGCLELDW